jgi:RNA polymerase sigma-70 factor (ECF subfamily)
MNAAPWPAETNDDDLLMHAAASGDRAAFALLLRRHRGWVLALVRAIVHDADQAEDLTQDVFCRLYARCGQFGARGQFVAYLKQIAINAARDHLRLHRRRPAGTPLHELAENVALPEDHRFDPAAVFASRALQQNVREALLRLNDEQQAVVLLHYFGGLSVEEIARKIRCPAGTVKSRLFHARRHLRETLAAESEEVPDRPVGAMPPQELNPL